jgi:23S rRNA (uracil-5-)-methyltransferase RumA
VTRPAKGQTIELPITTLAFGGQGLGHLDDFVVFVDGAVPGDVVRAVVTRTKKRYAEARLDKIVQPSSDRRDAVCQHFGTCGGCRWQSLDYPVQLHYKEQQVRDSLERLGGLSGFEVRPIVGMDHPWRYRNKVEFSIGGFDGRLVVGFHPPGRWDRVLPLEECHLLPETTEAIRTTVEDWLRSTQLAPWDARALTGYVRHLAVREARATGEVLVNLVTAPGDLPDADGLVQQVRTRHPQVVGILHSVNSGSAEVATGLPHQTLWGRPYLNERLNDLSLKISADAFFQTNTLMAETLYAVAAAEADLTGAEVVWDLYSGIGSIGLYMARAARAVLGIELVLAAVRDAHTNAELNGITNATWLEGDTRVVLKEVLEGSRELPAELSRPDVVVLDPPRGGLAHKVIARVAAAQPKRVIYVSCNPSTMAPNIALFQEAGYRLRRVTPVDMFPHTPHIEAVGLLEPATDT